MTNKEAIKFLKEPRMWEWLNVAQQIAIDMAIDALSQQSCEDCISREAVFAMSDYVGETPTYSSPYAKLEEVVRVEDIKSLPPVQPMRPKGHWERVTDKAGYLVWECDKCGWQKRIATNFCPDCGTDMR